MKKKRKEKKRKEKKRKEKKSETYHHLYGSFRLGSKVHHGHTQTDCCVNLTNPGRVSGTFVTRVLK